MQTFRNGSKGGDSNPGSRLRVRHSTAKLPRATSSSMDGISMWALGYDKSYSLLQDTANVRALLNMKVSVTKYKIYL